MKRYLTKSESILEFLPINLLIQMYWVIENQQKGMKPATDLVVYDNTSYSLLRVHI